VVFELYDMRDKKNKKNDYSPFCYEMVVLCSRREFIYQKGKLGPAHDDMFTPEKHLTAGQREGRQGRRRGARVKVRVRVNP